MENLQDAGIAVTFTSAETQAAIERETESIIQSTLARHPLLTREQITVGQLEDAKRSATATVEREQVRQSNPLFSELQAEKERSATLQAQVNALKTGRANIADTKQPALTVDAVRRQVGEVAWRHTMTDSQRLAAIGVAPDTVTPLVIDEIKSLFGKGADSHRANDTFKSSSARYRQLREIGRCLNLIAA